MISRENVNKKALIVERLIKKRTGESAKRLRQEK
jgi:hypothetical protein